MAAGNRYTIKLGFPRHELGQYCEAAYIKRCDVIHTMDLALRPKNTLLTKVATQF